MSEHTAAARRDDYPVLIPEGKLRGYWLLAPGVFQPPPDIMGLSWQEAVEWIEQFIPARVAA